MVYRWKDNEHNVYFEQPAEAMTHQEIVEEDEEEGTNPWGYKKSKRFGRGDGREQTKKKRI